MEQYEVTLNRDIIVKLSYTLLQDNSNYLVYEMGDKNPNKPTKNKQKKDACR